MWIIVMDASGMIEELVHGPDVVAVPQEGVAHECVSAHDFIPRQLDPGLGALVRSYARGHASLSVATAAGRL